MDGGLPKNEPKEFRIPLHFQKQNMGGKKKEKYEDKHRQKWIATKHFKTDA